MWDNSKIRYGYNSIYVGNIEVFTCKIRVLGEFKTNISTIRTTISGKYTFIEFETTDKALFNLNIRKISFFLKQMAIRRLEDRYRWINL